MRPVAVAERAVSGLPPTSTIRAAPCESRWVSLFILRPSLLAKLTQLTRSTGKTPALPRMAWKWRNSAVRRASSSRSHGRSGPCGTAPESAAGKAPACLAEADDGQNGAVDRPLGVADHEAAVERRRRHVEPLQDPDAAEEHHRHTQQGADDLEYRA